MAVASASAGLRLNDDAVVFGEVGLGGEIRSVLSSSARTKEAAKLGFKFGIGPQTRPKDAFIHPVTDLRDALNQYLTTKSK